MSALPAEAADEAYDDATPSRAVATGAPAAGPAAGRVRRPGLVVVPAVRRSSAPLAPFVAVVTALLVLGLAALLALNTVLAQDAFRIHDLEQANARLAEREQALGRQLDTVESPATLAERAEELGMVPSSSPLFLRLPDGAVLGAAPADEDGSADPDALVAVEAAGVAADAEDGESRPAGADSDSDSGEPGSGTSEESGSQESGSGTPEESSSGSSSGSEAGDGSGSDSGDSGTSTSGTSTSGTSAGSTSAGSASGSSESEEDTP